MCDCKPAAEPVSAPPDVGCTPCGKIPVVPPDGFTPCQVDPGCPPCCPATVCVPVMQPVEPPLPPPKPRRKCRYIQPERPKSFKPDVSYRPPVLKMEDDTIYRKSYLPVDGEKPDKILPVNNICVGTGKISNDTVNKMSYQGHPNILPPCLILPCEHKLIGDGPMQDITTNKHDYVPKPYSRLGPIVPNPHLYTSDCPLSDQTTNRLSYMPVDVNKAHVDPIHPKPSIERPTGKMSDKTVNKMSYLPWQPQESDPMPWAEKPKYKPPALRMDGNTINKMSYMAPGQYIECADDCPDAIYCPEDCEPHVQRNANCCLPCCCPKAAC